MKYAFAGDRLISVNILRFMIEKGYKPSALFVSEGSNESHAQDLIELANLDEDFVFFGNDFKKIKNIARLKEMHLDYIIGIHFPYIVPQAVLDLPKVGVLNLHPAYLPYNKGWHTPTWAIFNNDPYGATLHFMEKKLDQGDIIHQKKLSVLPFDTANSLYQKVLAVEEEVFYEAFDNLLTLKPKRFQQANSGTSHVKKDLVNIQEIDLDKQYTGQEIIDKIRALTTNSIEEAAFFKVNNNKIAVQVKLTQLND